jgi:hypothetical protein
MLPFLLLHFLLFLSSNRVSSHQSKWTPSPTPSTATTSMHNKKLDMKMETSPKSDPSISTTIWPSSPVQAAQQVQLPTNEDEEHLSIDIFKGYNSLIRPSPCYNQTIVNVDFGMAMILLINVDEKNQIMQSNAWLTLKWNDCQFR